MKSLSTIITLLTLLLFPIGINAGQYRIKATVTDSIGQPEMYVTWRIFENDSAKTL